MVHVIIALATVMIMYMGVCYFIVHVMLLHRGCKSHLSVATVSAIAKLTLHYTSNYFSLAD